VVKNLDSSLQARKMLPIGNTVVGTIVRSEGQVRYLRGHEQRVIELVDKGKSLDDAVPIVVKKARREAERKADQAVERRQARKEAAARANAPAKVGSIGRLVTAKSESGNDLGLLVPTPNKAGDLLIGTAKASERLVADQQPPDSINPQTVPYELGVVARRLEEVAGRLKQPNSKAYRENVTGQADVLTGCAAMRGSYRPH
jgi:hypothetical protein